MVYLILITIVASAVAVLALLSRAKAVHRANDAEVRALKTAKEMQRLKEAYREETKKLEEMDSGTDDERFDASLRILRDLSANGGS